MENERNKEIKLKEIINLEKIQCENEKVPFHNFNQNFAKSNTGSTINKCDNGVVTVSSSRSLLFQSGH